MSNLNSPIKFKNVKNVVPFVGDTFVFNKSYDTSIGNDLGLYNLLTLDITIKSNISKTNGLKVRISGRTINSESTTAIVVDGLLDNTDKFNESVILRKTGKYKIQYDISALKEGWIWLIPFTPSADVKVSDVCDIRVSIQNSNNLLSNPKPHPQIAYSYLNTKGGNAETNVDTKGLKALNLKINTYGSGDGYYELYFNGQNPTKELKGLMLYNKDGSELKDKKWSSYLNGYLWQVPSNEMLDLILDVSLFDSVAFSWVAKGTASTEIPYDMMFLNDDTAFDNISDIAYYGKSFVLESCKRITDCYWDTFIIVHDTYISVSTNGIDGNFKNIYFDATNFPNLKEGAKVERAWVLPYSATSSSQSGIYARVCLCFNNGQVYHNFPNRVPVGAKGGDEYRFDESVVWDLPIGQTSRKHPSKDINENRPGYRYDPTLIDYGYEMKPAINQDNGYGHGGFGDSIGTGDMTRPRFYSFQEPYRVNDSDKDTNVDIPFRILSYPCKTRKATFIGNYQINRSRICLFSTNDGGRNWFVEYEFSCNMVDVGYGNDINTTSVGAYTANSLSLMKRGYVTPSATDKEPQDKFTYGAKISISSISTEVAAIVTTSSAHGLSNKDVIILTKNDATSTPFDFMTNTPNVNDGGTGMMYEVKKINNTQFYLKEFIYSPDNNLFCRHIHYVQELKDFIAFGTGETYPNGWIMLLNQRMKDAYARIDPVTQFNTAYRLNSSKDAPQRLCSFWMDDDDSENPTIYLGSDEVGVKRPQLKVEGRTDLPTRSSAGIFRGKLSDIDDMSKFTSVFDVGDVNIYCHNMNGTLVAGFQMGHGAVSFDKGNTWEMINRGSIPVLAGVDRKNIIYFGNGTRLKTK